MSGWFRIYTEVLNDPKVQRLSGEHFKGWVNLLCLAKEGDGTLPDTGDIAFALRISDEEAAQLIATLKESGLVDENETGLVPHNWNGRQYKSDVSTDRVKRFRERSKKQDGNGKGNVSGNNGRNGDETPPETETETESETEGLPLTPSSPDLTEQAVSLWNSLADKHGLPKVQRLTERRKRALKARLSECGGLEGWKTALARVSESPFLLGQEKDWRADFDFVLQQSSFTKLMEGSYARKAAAGAAAVEPASQMTDEEKLQHENYIRGVQGKPPRLPDGNIDWEAPPVDCMPDFLKRKAG